jgi:hypothetical protein
VSVIQFAVQTVFFIDAHNVVNIYKGRIMDSKKMMWRKQLLVFSNVFTGYNFGSVLQKNLSVFAIGLAV